MVWATIKTTTEGTNRLMNPIAVGFHRDLKRAVNSVHLMQYGTSLLWRVKLHITDLISCSNSSSSWVLTFSLYKSLPHGARSPKDLPPHSPMASPLAFWKICKSQPVGWEHGEFSVFLVTFFRVNHTMGFSVLFLAMLLMELFLLRALPVWYI